MKQVKTKLQIPSSLVFILMKTKIGNYCNSLGVAIFFFLR